MFIGLRDALHAKGRFSLLVTVLVMMTTLILAVSALTRGLAAQSTSAVTALPATHFVLGADSSGAAASFSTSQIDIAALPASATSGAAKLGINMSAVSVLDKHTPVALFGIEGADAFPSSVCTNAAACPQAGEITLSQPTADALQLKVGDEVSVSGAELKVAHISADELMYAHVPTAYVNLGTWQQLNHVAPTVVTALMSSEPLTSVNGTNGQTLQALDGSAVLSAISFYDSEQRSLSLMTGLLFVISALVVGVFFAVWTLQRQADIAVLKALGASQTFVLRDALVQALAVIVVGVSIGVILVLGLGLVLPEGIPLVITAQTLATPALTLAALGLLGAAASTLSITKVSPLIALKASR